MTEMFEPRLLLVEGVEADRRAISEQLRGHFEVVETTTIQSAAQVLEEPDRVHLLLTHHQLPDGSGLEMLDIAAGYWPPIPVVFVVDPGSEAAAVEALRRGAADYVVKGVTEVLRLTQVLSNALARSEAEVAAQQRAREMGVLNTILTALNRQIGEEPVLDTIVQQVHALLGTDACSIILADENQDQGYLRASTRLPVRDMVWPVPLSKSVAGRIMRQKQGEITLDVTQDPDWHSLHVDDLIPRPVQSMLTVPLMAGDRAIGVLQAINKRVGPFLPSDLSLMESIAAVATIAIIRGREFAQAQEALQARANQATEIERVALAVMEETDGLAEMVSAPLEAIRKQIRRLVELAAD